MQFKNIWKLTGMPQKKTFQYFTKGAAFAPFE